MTPLKAFVILLFLPIYAEAAFSPQLLNQAINQELSELENRRAAAVEAYKQLDLKLSEYNAWCNTYGSTAVRNLLQFKILFKLLGTSVFPAYHVYSQDPYFINFRGKLDEKLSFKLPEKIDIGQCSLVELESKRISGDPKQFNPQEDESRIQSSIAYQVLTGNLRLIEGEKAALLELRGLLAAADEKAVANFLQNQFRLLQEQTATLRARTVETYEFNFRVPLGPLETLRDKEVGFKENEQSPGFFRLFKRRVFYVNQARLAAGKLFEVSVKNFSAAEALLSRFLGIIQEASPAAQMSLAQPDELQDMSHVF